MVYHSPLAIVLNIRARVLDGIVPSNFTVFLRTRKHRGSECGGYSKVSIYIKESDNDGNRFPTPRQICGGVVDRIERRITNV